MVLIVLALSALLILLLLGSLAKSQSTPLVNLAMLPERFIVLDLETTGLRLAQHEIIEIGAIRVNRDSTNHETFQTLVMLAKPLSKEIVQLTGITQLMIDRDGVSLEMAMSSFLDFIGDLPLVAFNAKFDLSFLRKAAGCQGLTISNDVSCALEMSRRAWPGLKSYRLQTLAKMGGLKGGLAHRALADCQLALTVYTSAASKLGSSC